MNIEKAFTTKFEDLFPTIPIFPIVANSGLTGLYAVYQTTNRQTENDLSNKTQMQTVNIQVFLISKIYSEVTEATWELINQFDIALGQYSAGSPIVQQTQVLSSSDTYISDLQLFQSNTDIQFYFN